MSNSTSAIEILPGEHVARKIDAIVETLGGIILGKDHELRLALTCLLARGHLLIEDIPGVGKTTLAHALARTLGLSYQRIQFTSDLLPADVVGVSLYERDKNQFRFHPGPLFNQVILADEINRATPKTQSALLEAMEEEQVTVDGGTHRLPTPFFVIATQNPSHQIGTFSLPESQLDRFLMRLHIGFPSPEVERQLLLGEDRHDLIRDTQPAVSPEQLVALQRHVERIHVAPALLDYLQDIVQLTRNDPRFASGLSPRAAIGLLRAARAWTLVRGGDAVLPEDLQAVTAPVIGHRVTWRDASTAVGDTVADYVLDSVPIDR